MDLRRSTCVLFIFCTTCVLSCHGNPLTKTKPKFPAIAKMTAKSHPMLASMFEVAGRAEKLNLAKKVGSKDPGVTQLLQDLNSQKEPGSNEVLPKQPDLKPTTFLRFGSSLMCGLCQEKNDLECIKIHCWNDGSLSSAGPGGTLSKEGLLAVPQNTNNIDLSKTLAQPKAVGSGSSGSQVVKPMVQFGLALPGALADTPVSTNIATDIQPLNGDTTVMKTTETKSLPKTFDELLHSKKYEGLTKAEIVPSALVESSAVINVPSINANNQQGAIATVNTQELGIVAQAPKPDMGMQNVANLENHLSNLMQGKSSLPVISLPSQGQSGNADFVADGNFGVDNTVQGIKTPEIPSGLPKSSATGLAMGRSQEQKTGSQQEVVQPFASATQTTGKPVGTELGLQANAIDVFREGQLQVDGPILDVDRPSFVGIGASLMCRLCQEKNDLECIRIHCWNDGSLSASRPGDTTIIQKTDTQSLPKTFAEFITSAKYQGLTKAEKVPSALIESSAVINLPSINAQNQQGALATVNTQELGIVAQAPQQAMEMQKVAYLENHLSNLMQGKSSLPVISLPNQGQNGNADFVADVNFGVDNTVQSIKTEIPPGLPKSSGQVLSRERSQEQMIVGQQEVVQPFVTQAKGTPVGSDLGSQANAIDVFREGQLSVGGSVLDNSLSQLKGLPISVSFGQPEIHGQESGASVRGQPVLQLVARADTPEVFARDMQRLQEKSAINQAATPPTTTLQTMSPQRKAQLTIFSKGLFPPMK